MLPRSRNGYVWGCEFELKPTSSARNLNNIRKIMDKEKYQFTHSTGNKKSGFNREKQLEE